MDWPTILASLGALLSIISNIPQVIRVIPFHTTKGLEPTSIIIHILGALVWTIYGVILELYILAGESFLVCFFWILILVACARDRLYPEIQEQEDGDGGSNKRGEKTNPLRPVH